MEGDAEETKIFEEIYGTKHEDHHGAEVHGVFDHPFPTKDEIKDKEGNHHTVAGVKGCKKCHGSGWIHDKHDIKKMYTCESCNPTVCHKCMGTHWNFEKDKHCTDCPSDKHKDKKHHGDKHLADHHGHLGKHH